MFKYDLFCTVTMKSYKIHADSEYEAKKELSKILNIPLSCIDVYK